MAEAVIETGSATESNCARGLLGIPSTPGTDHLWGSSGAILERWLSVARGISARRAFVFQAFTCHRGWAMSIVAISETVGSLGIEIGRKLAENLGWEFADREILSKASEQFGEDVTELRHSVEEKPTLWERFSDTQHRYKAYVEAIMLEMAARDNVVLAGRSSTIVLRPIPHVVRVRTSAPERTRAQRLENEMGLTNEAALNFVRHSDRERAARVKFLYQLDVDDSLLYDLVLNTERLTVEKGAALI